VYITVIGYHPVAGCQLCTCGFITAIIGYGCFVFCRAAEGCGSFDVSSLNSETFHALSLVFNQIFRGSPIRPRTTVMADLLASYNALSAASPRADVSKVLNAIISGLLLIP